MNSNKALKQSSSNKKDKEGNAHKHFLPREQSWQLMATCPKGVEFVLADELAELGASEIQQSVAAVYFTASQANTYRICLWSRIASRLLILLDRCVINRRDDIEPRLRELPWAGWFSAYKNSFAVDFSGSNRDVRDSRYGAQLVKDSINDHFAELDQPKPRVNLDSPDVLIYVRLFKNKWSIGLDLVGERLHKRGYRQQTGDAPLRENLAAALLRIAGWNAMVDKHLTSSSDAQVDEGDRKQPLGFIDPMCGSATLLIEAAMIALRIPPNALPVKSQRKWALTYLRGFDEAIWNEQRQDAAASLEKAKQGAEHFVIQGFDVNQPVLAAAQKNLAAAGLDNIVTTKQVAVDNLTIVQPIKTGLLLCNPPYGKRLGDADKLEGTYKALGDCMKRNCLGWDAALFTGNPDLGWSTGLRSWRQHHLYNGSIPCDLQRYRIQADRFIDNSHENKKISKPLSDSAQMLFNRLGKNQRRLKSWLLQSEENCYRLYDADLPEYAFAVDVYKGSYQKTNPWGSTPLSSATKSRLNQVTEVHCQEYAPPASVNQRQAAIRLREAVNVICRFLDIDEQAVAVKTRLRQRGKNQYEKQGNEAKDLHITESGYSFIVNLSRYLDTGIFLDHRPVRRLVAANTKGKRFLNLFAYTATATVYAAKAGARSSVSVDMSRTYMEWAKRNFEANGISTAQHRLIQADCLQWLETHESLYDCILLDPPSFSNSKRMETTLDIQRDQFDLVQACMNRLADGGKLFFSNNRKGFKLDKRILEQYHCTDLTVKTTDLDFKQARLTRQCWLVEQA